MKSDDMKMEGAEGIVFEEFNNHRNTALVEIIVMKPHTMLFNAKILVTS